MSEQKHWSVSVEVAGDDVLTISSQHMAGKEEMSAAEINCIEQAARNLLGFIDKGAEDLNCPHCFGNGYTHNQVGEFLGECDCVFSLHTRNSIPDAELWKLLPDTARYLDPPDGGSPSLLTQLQRMAKDAHDFWATPVGEKKPLTDDIEFVIEVLKKSTSSGVDSAIEWLRGLERDVIGRCNASWGAGHKDGRDLERTSSGLCAPHPSAAIRNAALEEAAAALDAKAARWDREAQRHLPHHNSDCARRDFARAKVCREHAAIIRALQSSPAPKQDADNAPYPFLPSGWHIQQHEHHGYAPASKSGDRGEWMPTRQAATAAAWAFYADEMRTEADRLNQIINSPQSGDFLRAVSTEGEHQRQRWGSSHDAGKTAADWFWLVGYLAGKALHAHAAGDLVKAEHHVITAAAALLNWHMAMFGKTDMRPGIDGTAVLDGSAA